MSNIGILAYGSLIDDPGPEIARHIIGKISCTTPFPIEYSRMSKSRGFAPTLIPVKNKGSKVNALILLMNNKVSIEQVKDMLWRRETRQKDQSKCYVEKSTPDKNTVQIKVIDNFENTNKVVYTSIPPNVGLVSGAILATLAIKSILSEAGEKGLDGVRYLMAAKRNGIITPLTDEYESEILKYCGVSTLEEAIAKLDSERPANLKKKVDFGKFEKQIRELADFACEYGFEKTVSGQNWEPEKLSEFLEKNKLLFIENCHDGYKKAQDQILTLMLEFEKRRTELEQILKGLDRKKQQKEYSSFLQEIMGIEAKEDILRHLIDTIAYQLISGQVHVSRRLFQGVEGKKRLLKTNIESVMKAAEKFNKSKMDFALITDLSTYIQTGDILLRKGDGTIAYVEVKDGKKNHELFRVMNEIINTKKPVEEVVKSANLDVKSAEQLDRNLKQFLAMYNTVNIINTDKGWDKKGKPVKVITPKEDVPRFIRELRDLYVNLQTRNVFSYDVIEDCLHVGIFKGPLNFIAPSMMEAMSKKANGNFIHINFLSVIKSLYKPLFFLPFPKEFLFDILFERVSIIFVLDLDNYLTLFPEFKMNAEWLTRKETMKAIEAGSKNMFIKDHKCIRVTDEISKDHMYLAEGTFQKIIFEHIYPSYTAYSCRYYFENLD
jgi:hypothetical protein